MFDQTLNIMPKAITIIQDATQSLKSTLDESYRSTHIRFFKAFHKDLSSSTNFYNFCIFKGKPTTLFIKFTFEIRLRI